MRRFLFRFVGPLVIVAAATPIVVVATTATSSATSPHHQRHEILIPEADKFVPFHLTIHSGDSVTWVNNDTDDHTIVSDDAFNSAGHHGLDHLIPGTDSNNGQPGTYVLKFTHPGTFVYYCRFHSHLDQDAQPVAPGPNGGIQDANGNFGTPMSGVITVSASHADH